MLSIYENPKLINNSAKKRKFNFWGFLLLGLLVGALLHTSFSCIDSFSFDREKVKIDEAGIKKGAAVVEAAFANADTSALAAILTETSLEIYGETFEQIKPYMPEYAKAFKSRKLLFANQIFAVYEFKVGNEVYTVEMNIDDDGAWKLVRF